MLLFQLNHRFNQYLNILIMFPYTFCPRLRHFYLFYYLYFFCTLFNTLHFHRDYSIHWFVLHWFSSSSSSTSISSLQRNRVFFYSTTDRGNQMYFLGLFVFFFFLAYYRLLFLNRMHIVCSDSRNLSSNWTKFFSRSTPRIIALCIFLCSLLLCFCFCFSFAFILFCFLCGCICACVRCLLWTSLMLWYK